MRRVVLFLGFFLWPVLVQASDHVIAVNSEEGLRRLERAEYKADFLPLANHFERQSNDFFCGVASSVIVLNALTHSKEYYETQENFFTADTDKIKTKQEVMGEAKKEVPDYGFQLTQLKKMLEAHRLKVIERVATDKLSDETIRNEFIGNLGRKEDFILVNYFRPILGQKGGGHISPVGAYDKTTDSVLILDVNPSMAEWVWVTLPTLIKAMKTHDTLENRGYLMVQDA